MNGLFSKFGEVCHFAIFKFLIVSLYIELALTARNQLTDKVVGYESGADIYLVKPVDPVELLATIFTLSRRVTSTNVKNQNKLQLDVKGLFLQGVKSRIQIMHIDAAILQGLARAKNQQLAYWQLIELIGKVENSVFKKSNLELKIHRLRQKIVQVSDEKNVIKSIREQGYQLCIDLVIEQGKRI